MREGDSSHTRLHHVWTISDIAIPIWTRLGAKLARKPCEEGEQGKPARAALAQVHASHSVDLGEASVAFEVLCTHVGTRGQGHLSPIRGDLF